MLGYEHFLITYTADTSDQAVTSAIAYLDLCAWLPGVIRPVAQAHCRLAG